MRSLQSELIEKGFSDARTSEMERNNTKTNDKQSERLTDREWRELMGVNRDTFRRGKGGAIKRR